MGDEYGGARYKVIGHLSNIRVPLCIDIATGDPTYPHSKIGKYYTILGDEIELKLYPIESVLSEKIQTTLIRGINNSRIKDLYDISYIVDNKLVEIDTNNFKMAMKKKRYR